MISFQGDVANVLAMHTWLVIPIGVGLAGLLLFVRMQWRKIYGLVEVVAGISLLCIASNSVTVSRGQGAFNSDFSDAFDIGALQTSIILTAFIGGVFGVIRGFDTIFSRR